MAVNISVYISLGKLNIQRQSAGDEARSLEKKQESQRKEESRWPDLVIYPILLTSVLWCLDGATKADFPPQSSAPADLSLLQLLTLLSATYRPHQRPACSQQKAL